MNEKFQCDELSDTLEFRDSRTELTAPLGACCMSIEVKGTVNGSKRLSTTLTICLDDQFKSSSKSVSFPASTEA